MPKRLGSGEVNRVLKQHGFVFVSMKGSHAHGRSAIVPHPNKELPIGTTRSIIRQAGLTPKDFGF